LCVTTVYFPHTKLEQRLADLKKIKVGLSKHDTSESEQKINHSNRDIEIYKYRKTLERPWWSESLHDKIKQPGIAVRK